MSRNLIAGVQQNSINNWQTSFFTWVFSMCVHLHGICKSVIYLSMLLIKVIFNTQTCVALNVSKQLISDSSGVLNSSYISARSWLFNQENKVNQLTFNGVLITGVDVWWNNGLISWWSWLRYTSLVWNAAFGRAVITYFHGTSAIKIRKLLRPHSKS